MSLNTHTQVVCGKQDFNVKRDIVDWFDGYHLEVAG